MNNLDRQYTELLNQILHFGVTKKDRTGTGTKSIFGYQIRHNMKEGFPLLTTKKMAWKGIVTELLWFLKGDTNIKYLLENDCHIWSGDAYKRYTTKLNKHYTSGGDIADIKQFEELILKDDEFAQEWGNLGPIYGKQWRFWNKLNLLNSETGEFFIGNQYIDQIANLIDDLNTNPDSRRMMVTAWNPAEVPQAVLPPCHYGFQVYTRELSHKERYKLWFHKNYETGFEYDDSKDVDYKNPFWSPTPSRAISLLWNQRSCDTFLGIPFNIASYGLLLEILAKEVNMVPDDLIGNLGDTHLYLNHLEQAEEQIKRVPYELPKLAEIPDYDWLSYNPSDFVLQDYKSHPSIKAPISN